jgi:hypothetical protein
VPVARGAFESELGVQAPVGYWDPLGMAADGDVEDFTRRREAELKNGRVAMFACIGYIVPEYTKFPGYLAPSADLKFADVPNGLAAVSKVPAEGWLQWLALCGFYEVCINGESASGEPGNYGRGRLGFTGTSIQDPDGRKRALNAELANGRLAMVAIIGMFFQDGLTGSAWGDWALYKGSGLHSGKMSPGYNTLPEWEGIASGFEGSVGDQEPLGFWDPAGFTKDGDVEKFKRRREVELKHGRVSMLATIGYMVPEYYKFPGYLSPSEGLKFEDVPNGLGALSKVPPAGLAQFAAFIAFLELVYNKPSAEPGNYGKGSLGLGSIGLGGSITDPKLRAKKLGAEVSNGRLAMVAIIGMFFQDGLTGSAWGDWALYTGSPLRSGKMSPGYNTLPEWEGIATGFEGSVGDQEPLGFWDPAGFTKDGDVEKFKRRREVELKHGRVSMLATIGYMVPEYYKFPGYLSPSEGLKFEDVPNGLAALSKVPPAGLAQFAAFIAFLELVYNKPSAEPGNYGKGNLGLGSIGLGGSITDSKLRAKKLGAEVSNGRLAMVAIIGMFFQDGLTGSAWGDWALYTGSPLRGFENETGVTKPFGYWDPLGMSEDGDVLEFRRRREAEIKNGRVAMIACIGWIVPEYYRWPGYVSPSQEIKFTDLPNGFAALKAMPADGWAQIGVFIAFLELFPLRQEKDRAPGDFPTCGRLGVPWFFVRGAADYGGPNNSDPVANKRGLDAEINNGRLAMVAITGMAFQNGVTGSTGYEMYLP